MRFLTIMKAGLIASLAAMSLGVAANTDLRERIYYETVVDLYEREHPTARLIIALQKGNVSPHRNEKVIGQLDAVGRFLPEPQLQRIMMSSGGLTDWVFMRDVRNREMADRLRYPEIYTFTRLVDYRYRDLQSRAGNNPRLKQESIEDIVDFWSEHVALGEWDYKHQRINRAVNQIQHRNLADMEKDRISNQVLTESFRRFGGDSDARDHWVQEELARRMHAIDDKYTSQANNELELHKRTANMQTWIAAMWDMESRLLPLSSWDYKKCDNEYACMAFLKLPTPPLVLN